MCTSILILWTVLDPWKWERSVVKELPPESYGQCKSQHIWAWFGPLICVLFFAQVLTWYFAWKTADIPEDFQDSTAVMYASLTLLQSWAFGVPMLAVIGSTSSDASYFARICLIWVFSVSSVVVVVGPKLVSAYRIRRKPALEQINDRVRVSGLINPTSSHQVTQSSVNTGHRQSEVSCTSK
jgi:7 transmembrane sweet-taste receptor of 3 GCPR